MRKQVMAACVAMVMCGAGIGMAAEDSNDAAGAPGRAAVPFEGSAAEAVDASVILATAEPTIFLDVSGVQSTISVPSTVTHDPTFDFYYASGTGNPARPGFVFGASGGAPIDVEEPLNIDVRAWNYNANTAQLETVTYDAVAGGAGRGLIEAQTDGSGLLTGGTATLLAAMPGNNGNQTAPAFDPAANVFYSRDDNNVVNVVSRVDGSLATTLNLDFATAGVTSVPDDGIVFVPEIGALGVLDGVADTLSLFDLSGAYLATVSLPVDITDSARRPGYANGQLFVWDNTLVGWQGLQILGPPSITAIPGLSPTGFAALALLLAGVALTALRRRRS